MVSQPDGFFWNYFAGAAGLLTRYETLNRMIRKDSADIADLYAQSRNDGYKFSSIEDALQAELTISDLGPKPKAEAFLSMYDAAGDGDLASVFGSLQPWDRYFVDLNGDANAAFPLGKVTFYHYDAHFSSSDRFGRMFLQNVAWVNTFITNAAYDLVVYCPGLPRALGLHTEMLLDSRHDTAGPEGATRPGQILLDYRPSVVPGSDVRSRAIRFPYYAQSGHAVTLTEPAEILSDVIEWLGRTGLPTSDSKPGGEPDAAPESEPDCKPHASSRNTPRAPRGTASGRVDTNRGGRR
jgi:hypothetical protein